LAVSKKGSFCALSDRAILHLTQANLGQLLRLRILDEHNDSSCEDNDSLELYHKIQESETRPVAFRFSLPRISLGFGVTSPKC
jgi:hypothetical protein